MKSQTFGKAVILGATGPTGVLLASHLRDQVETVRAVSRSIENLKRCFPEEGIELREANLLDAAAVRNTIDECDLVFNCIGLPTEQMDMHPVAARNIAEAMKQRPVRCVHVSSYWSYLPVVKLPVTETHPREGGPDWVRYRREAEDLLQSAGAAVVHLPDFFGPLVHTSTLQNAIREAVEGKDTVNWIGGREIERDYLFVQDAARIISQLALLPEAYGERWILKGSGPLSGQKLAQFLSTLLGRPIHLRCAGIMMLRIVSLFKKELRGFLQMVPDYAKPITYDATKLEKLLGRIELTRYPEALSQTIDWLGN